ncbi:hypothetical protein ACWD7F_31230 [Streptomyces sp. NPDC005122]
MPAAAGIVDDLTGYAEYAGWSHTLHRSRPGGHLVLPGAYLKWYDIRGAEQDATPAVSEAARVFLRAEEAAGRLAFRKEFGYVLLHRCGDNHFMQVCVWRDRNELVQAIYADTGGGFRPYEQEPGLQLAAQDVVELDVTGHERRAWSLYLRSARDTAAKRAYLDDFDTERPVG